jgi:hypothetical protein
MEDHTSRGIISIAYGGEKCGSNQTINWLVLQDMMDMRPSIFVDGIGELWDSPGCQLFSTVVVHHAGLVWPLPPYHGQPASSSTLSLSTGTSSHLLDEFWQKYTLCYSFCNIYHSSLIKQQGTDLICFDCHTLTITKKNLSEICREIFLCKLSEMFRVWFGSYSNSGCTITILKADAEEINYCTTKQGIFRWALLWMCAPCLFLPCSINPKS